MASPSPAQGVRHKSELPQYATRNPGFTEKPRDKPLFTSMRRAQFQQEFTTDSLNNTAIGSPSPAKPLRAFANGADRPTRDTGLAAAFRRFEYRTQNEEMKDPASANRRRGKGAFTRPTLPHHHVSEIPSPSPKAAPLRPRAQTPSPPRGRPTDFLLSPMSEVSESSPPREFAEAYKQINDQEDLAAFEEDLDSAEETEDVAEGGLLEPVQKSSRRSSRRRSPGVDDAIILDSPEPEPPETKQASMPSLPSDLETDDASQLSRHQRDLKRLDLALGHAKPLSKIPRRQKLGGSKPQADNASSSSGGGSDNSNTSGSLVSDSSLNIPSTWGRKARHGKNWLSRLDRDMQGKSDQDDVFNVNNSKPVKAEKEAMEDLQAEASMTPLPAAQDQDSLEHSPSPAPTKPASLIARDRVRKLAFGEDKFLTKTQEEALARARNPALNLIREREIENLAKSAVTTNRLGELKERQSLERVGGRPTTSGSELDQASDIKTDREPLLKSQPSQPLFAAAPVAKYENSNLKETPSVNARSEDPVRAVPQVTDNHPTGLRTPPPERSTKLQSYLKTPLVTGAWIDTPLPAVKSEPVRKIHDTNDDNQPGQPVLEKVQPIQPKDEEKDAPDSQVRQEMLNATAPKLPGSALAAIITRAKDKKAQGIPSQGEDTLLLDDSTILSLEELVASGEDSDTESSESEDHSSKELFKPKKHKSAVSRLNNKSFPSEDKVEITTRLDRLRSSIQDAKMGLGSLQKRVARIPERTISASSSRASSVSRPQSECEEAGEFHDFIWPCEKCGHKAGSTLWDSNEASLLDWHWRPIQVYMPQLWFWPSSTASVPRLTKLGWWGILCAIFIFTEVILHDMYSPPFYASSMSGYGVNIHAPRPPFVLPKLIWTHILCSPLESIRFLLQVFVRFLASILGLDPSSFSIPGSDSATDDWSSRNYVYSPARSAADGNTQALGMDADEYL